MILNLEVKIDRKFIDEDIINNYRQSARMEGHLLKVKIQPKIPEVLMREQNIVDFCDTWFGLLKIISMLWMLWTGKSPELVISLSR